MADDIDWVRGHHHISFGADWIHSQLNSTGSNGKNGMFTFNGTFTGDALADCMIGRPSEFNRPPCRRNYTRQNYIGLYSQDDIRSAPAFPSTPDCDGSPSSRSRCGRAGRSLRAAFDAGQKLANYDNAPPGLFFQGDPGIPAGYTNRRLPLFEPRIGLAWDPRAMESRASAVSYSLGLRHAEMSTTPAALLQSAVGQFGVSIRAPPAAHRIRT